MLEWITTCPGSPYFCTESGESWTPIGQNDGITWPQLMGLYKREDYESAVLYFDQLKSKGINCMRLMLEYCQNDRRYLEKPAGTFQKNMVNLWDDIFALAEKYSIRLLITPYDTFWMWRRWKHHPYNKLKGGTCKIRSHLLFCPDTRALIKNRLEFATKRWGGSGALFAWDLWNEIHPAHANQKSAVLIDYVEDVGTYLKNLEMGLYGKAHLQTVSVYGHEIISSDAISALLFRNPVLDFASTHFYEKATIDSPKNTIVPALSTGKFVREALLHIEDQRPFLDTEHGPIYRFSRRKITLAEAFDDEYFHYMQWAHLASGGSGGGMRWPYRQPHQLTNGMRKSQGSLAKFAALVDWENFNRVNSNEEIHVCPEEFHVFSCQDSRQVLVWLLRNNALNRKGMMTIKNALPQVWIELPWISEGQYRVTVWNTWEASIESQTDMRLEKPTGMKIPVLGVKGDAMVYVKRLNE